MELSAWINPTYLSEEWIADMREQYLKAAPFPHAALPDFLLEERFLALSDALSEKEFVHKESDLFSLAQTKDLSGEEGIIGEYAALLGSDALRGWMASWTGVEARGGTDLFGAVYQDTDYLLPHDDRLEDRRLACILYLTSLSADEGGALALYDTVEGHPGRVVERHVPIENTLGIFTVSEESWHEVEEVTGEAYRVSLGGWLRG